MTSGDSGLHSGAPDVRNSDLVIVTPVNDEAIFARNLAVSPIVADKRVHMHVERGQPSAAIAYNHALDTTTEELIAFMHQDVYLPPGWEDALRAAISAVEAVDPNWALLSPNGVNLDGLHVGEVWSTSLGKLDSRPAPQPVPAQSYDELCFVMRRSAGLRFDEGLPGYHLYATDIVQTAWQAGKGAYVMDIPTIHNDKFHQGLAADFREAYAYMRRKWRERLPIRSPVLWITRHGLELHVRRLRMWRSEAKRQKICLDPTVDPRLYARRCGYE